MKNSYKGFRQLSEADFKSLWKTAVFVFDANVLLNLYRYQSPARDDLLKVLKKLGDRIWIPYHVGLEFERNRLVVIADQKRRFSEVKRTVEKSKNTLIAELEELQLSKRHSLINPAELVEGYEQLTKKFLNNLDGLQKKQQGLTGSDPLREKVEKLFDDRVGSPPANQDVIDKINKEGEKRFAHKIPPGFEDGGKGKEEADGFLWGGILYKRKYGDLIVWRQILDHAKSLSIKSLVFVTDDNKEDWWQKINSDGPKTIGPRPELADEILTEAGVETFYMYSPEGFLKYSKEHLHTEVKKDTLEEVRDISVSRSSMAEGVRELRRRVRSAENAVYKWVKLRFEEVEINRYSFPDIIARSVDKKYGFDVRFVQNPNTLEIPLLRRMYQSEYLIKEEDFDEISIVLVFTDITAMNIVTKNCATLADKMPSGLRIVIGFVETDRSGEIIDFFPHDIISSESN